MWKGAMNSDIVIYISPSGIAWAKNIPIIGLYAKGEDFGLMRKMMTIWCERYTEVIDLIDGYNKTEE